MAGNLHGFWKEQAPRTMADDRRAAAFKARKGKKQKSGGKKSKSRTPFRAAPKSDADFYRSLKWRQLRYLVLVNTKGRCQCCGASAEDGVKIHVDHIKPRCTHPELELSLDNMQCLCEDCNCGKGSWDSTDWRAKMG